MSNNKKRNHNHADHSVEKTQEVKKNAAVQADHIQKDKTAPKTEVVNVKSSDAKATNAQASDIKEAAVKSVKTETVNVKKSSNTKTAKTEAVNTKETKAEANTANHKVDKSASKAEVSNTADAKKETEAAPAKKTAVHKGVPRVLLVSAVKIALPVLACVIVIVTIVTLVQRKNSAQAEAAIAATEISTEESATLPEEPLSENAYPEVNAMIQNYYQALADGNLEVIQSLKDYTDETELITYEKKSEFIEAYHNIVCYTKPGLEENSYFLYAAYDVKFTDIETTAPGLNTMYVYTTEDGSLKIDGDTDESVTAALKLVSNQDDVVDLFNKIDVRYKEAVAADESLNTFLTELPNQIKTSVGIALAQLEAANAETDETAAQEETEAQTESEASATEISETPETVAVQTVQQVKATDTVNVRASDSETADRIGRVEQGTILTRTEEKINGWSKVIYEDKEAYIKSDYLEVVSSEVEGEAIGTVTATTNVNVRNAADQEADKLGVAQAESKYNLLEDLGEWYRIDYNGQTGYVKSEFFE